MAKSTRTFILKDSNGNLIAGFNRQHQIVQWAGDVKNAKQWKTENGATKWAETYVDAGYGFGSGYSVEEVI